MGKHFADKMHAICVVLSSDEDQPIVMSIMTGFTDRDELAVTIDSSCYEDKGFNCSTAVIVNTADARKMARRHKVKYAELPVFISECMAEWREIVNPDFKQVRACFREITDCLLDEGCRFRLVRTTGNEDLMCL